MFRSGKSTETKTILFSRLSRLTISSDCFVEKESYQVRKTLLESLKACIGSRDLSRGKLVHSEAMKSGDDTNIYVGTSLINMYAKCGSMIEARRVFDKMPSRNLVTWNSLILGYAENGEELLALELFQDMQGIHRFSPDGRTFLAVLKAYTSLAIKETSEGKWRLVNEGVEIHLRARSSGSFDIFVASALVSLFAKCGSLVKAWMIFERMPVHNVVPWNTLMLGYVENGQPELGLELFEKMRSVRDSQPDSLTYAAALKACTSLVEACKVEGKPLSNELLENCLLLPVETQDNGFECDGFVASALVCLHSKLGKMSEAQRAFDRIRQPDIILWNSLLAGYVENGEPMKALKISESLDCEPNPSTFVALFKGCGVIAAASGEKLGALEKCRELHRQASGLGFNLEMFVASTLVDCYAKCGSMIEARGVFDRMPQKDVVSWTSLISGYGENGDEELALSIFTFMQEGDERIEPDALTYVAALKACTGVAGKEEARLVEGKFVKLRALRSGSEIHQQVTSSRSFEKSIMVANTLVDFYSNCGDTVEARRVFESMNSPTVVSWTAMILGYAENGEWELALETFSEMQTRGFSHGCFPNSRTFVAAFKACSVAAAREEGRRENERVIKPEALERGRILHRQASSCGCEWNLYLSNTIVDFYSKCGSLEDARRVFEGMQQRDSVSWTVLLLGYVESHEYEEVLELFERMKDEASPVEALSFVAAFKACSGLASAETGEKLAAEGKLVKLKALERGMAIHSQASAGGCEWEIVVMNTLVDMYSNCGSMGDARRVFDTASSHTVVSWNSLIAGYVENGYRELALELFLVMQGSGIHSPDERTFTAALKACCSEAGPQAGKMIHSGVCRSGFETDSILETSLVEFYGKSGNMADAQHVFDSRKSRPDAQSWSSIIEGYSRQGDANRVLELLREMEEQGLKPHGSVLVSVLTACSHAGLLDEGRKLFEAMKIRYGVEPEVEHYNCMVDLLSRANKLEEAVDVVKRMPFEHQVHIAWNTILGACCKWKNPEIGKLAFDHLMKIEETDGAAYVLMANLFSGRETLEEKVDPASS